MLETGRCCETPRTRLTTTEKEGPAAIGEQCRNLPAAALDIPTHGPDVENKNGGPKAAIRKVHTPIISHEAEATPTPYATSRIESRLSFAAWCKRTGRSVEFRPSVVT